MSLKKPKPSNYVIKNKDKKNYYIYRRERKFYKRQKASNRNSL